MLKYIFLAVVCAGQSVAADCPQILDAQNGISLTRKKPFFSITLKPTNEGLTEQRVVKRNSKTKRVSSIHPHPLVAGGSVPMKMEH
jgi:hypothetical protein